MNVRAPHTALGNYNARKTIEDEHRDGHLDGRGEPHQTAMCRLCVEQAAETRFRQEFYR